MNLTFATLEKIIEEIKSGRTTSKELFDYFLGRIKKYDSQVQAFNFINENGLNNGQSGSLFGVPIAVKDIFCEKGIPTTAASKMLENFVPPYDATVILKLKDAGVSSIGKTNMDEFAMGSSTENSAFKKTKNPWHLDYVPGGSSGGSAAAVAAGFIPASLGTDTGGSIRQPASLCGIVGFKPTYGRNSRFGVMPMASSLDCPGTFTRCVKDAALLYDIMNGEDIRENTTLPGKHKIDAGIWSKTDLQGVTIGIPKEYFDTGIDEGVKLVILKAIDDMKKLGAQVIDVSLPMTKYAMAVYYVLCPAEVATNLARLDGIRYGYSSEKSRENLEEFYIHNRGEGLGKEPQRRSILGSYVLSAGFYDSYFKKAAQVRTLVIQEFDDALSKCDVLVCPASPTVAWKIGEKSEDPLQMYLSDAYTIPASLAGLPGISIPCGFSKSKDGLVDLPVGLQILGPRLGEEKVFEVAHIFEQSTKWCEQMIPPNFKND